MSRPDVGKVAFLQWRVATVYTKSVGLWNLSRYGGIVGWTAIGKARSKGRQPRYRECGYAELVTTGIKFTV